MKQHGLTVITTVKPDRLEALRRVLDDINRQIDVGCGPGATIDFSRMRSVHFAAWVVIPAFGGAGYRLLFETNYDGDVEAHFDELLTYGSAALDSIYSLCDGCDSNPTRDTERFKQYLRRYSLKPSAFYVAFPERSVADIQNSIAVAASASRYIDDQAAANDGFEHLSGDQTRVKVVNYIRGSDERPLNSPVDKAKLHRRVLVHWLILFIPTLISLLILLVTCLVARFYEKREERTVLNDLTAFNLSTTASAGNLPDTQNHMCTITTVKPGYFRRLTLKGVLAAANIASKWIFILGKLGPLPTIHFARWLLIDNDRFLLFLSNYDGIWSGYLSDFADQGWGVTAIWSNTVAFPPTRYLLFHGGRNIERFEANVRAHLLPTQVFYRAYPGRAVRTLRGDLDNRDELAKSVRAADEVDARARRSDLDRGDIQGIVASGYNHLNYVRYVLLHIKNRANTQRWLREILNTVSTAQLRGHCDEQGRRRVNIAFTFSGLRQLGLPEETLDGFPEEFRDGMAREGAAEILGDSSYSDWEFGARASKRIDILLLLYADTAAELSVLVEEICGNSMLQGCASPVWHQDSKRGPGDLTEPFGFRDGISQPQVIGLVHKPPWRAEELVATGEFVLGHKNEYGVIAALPAVPNSYDSNRILRPHPECPQTHKDFGFDGSFLVVRKLEQNIRAFSSFIEAHSRGTNGLSDPYQAELLAARMVGRWRSGAPLALTPKRDCPVLGTDPVINNAFLYGDDLNGLKCPIGAHIRRANPRDGQDFGPSRSFVLSQRHRIIRRGRKYKEDVTGPTGDTERREGIVFVAINADLRRQFEFVQSTWINNPSFMGLHNDRDPVVGNNDEEGLFTIPGKSFDRQLAGLSRFVKVRGGAYFFLPGIAALKFLANCPLSEVAAVDAPTR